MLLQGVDQFLASKCFCFANKKHKNRWRICIVERVLIGHSYKCEVQLYSIISRPQEVDEDHLSFVKLKVIIRNVLLTEIDRWPFNTWIIACTGRSNILPLWLTDIIHLIVLPYLSEIFLICLVLGSTVLGSSLENQNVNSQEKFTYK